MVIRIIMLMLAVCGDDDGGSNVDWYDSGDVDSVVYGYSDVDSDANIHVNADVDISGTAGGDADGDVYVDVGIDNVDVNSWC